MARLLRLEPQVAAAFAFRQASLLIAVSLVFACNAPRPDESGYGEDLLRARATKDTFLQHDAESPMPADKSAEFLPLSYYAPDLAYRIPATLVFADEPVLVEVPTSAGTIDQLQRVGVLEFFLDGETRTLSAFVSSGGGSLFVPFRDETSGEETYGAGRYLDIDVPASGIYPIDFNHAYHPNCYLNAEFICPLPPLQNRLTTAIHAGERLPMP